MSRILFSIWSLSGGGAERVMAELASKFAAKGHECVLVTSVDIEDSYRVDARVSRIRLALRPVNAGKLGAAYGFLRNLLCLRRAIKRVKPDVIISFIDQGNVLTLLAARGSGVPVIVSERINPAVWSIRPIWHQLRHFTYRSAAAVVAQTEDARDWLRVNVPAPRYEVIPNWMRVVEEQADGALELERVRSMSRGRRLFVGMGRLEHQKGFDLVIEAFAVSPTLRQTACFAVMGDGPQRKTLEDSVGRHGLQGQVAFLGRLTNPGTVLAIADCFVMPSRAEGFPNALLEAMAEGVASVAADCRSGPADIIRDGVTGLLVPVEDTRALRGAMERMCLDAALRTRLGAAGKVAVHGQFGQARVFAQWEELVEEVVLAHSVSKPHR